MLNETYKKLYSQAKPEIIKLRQAGEIQDSRMQQQDSRMLELEKTVAELRRLAYHYSHSTLQSLPTTVTPHYSHSTLPSANTLAGQEAGRYSAERRKNYKPKPRRAPAGHRGATSRPKLTMPAIVLCRR